MAAAISVNLAATAVPAEVTATTATIAINAMRSAYSSRSWPSSLRVRTAARKFVMSVMFILLRDAVRRAMLGVAYPPMRVASGHIATDVPRDRGAGGRP